MSLATTRELVDAAVEQATGLLAFNVITLEHAEGIVAGAERAGCPVLLQVSENAIRFHGDRFAPLLGACRALAIEARVPIAVHLDHIADESLATRLIAAGPELGVSSIMVDAAAHEFALNVESTRRLAQSARDNGLFVEAELGAIGGKDGAHAPGVRTDPGEAAAFVAATGVDALAVAVGSSHAMTARTADIDLRLVAELTRSVAVPLVLHGSSGVAVDTLIEAVDAGIRKINVGTALNVAFTRSVRSALGADVSAVDPRRYLAPGRDAIAEAVAELCERITSTDRTEAAS